MAAPVLGRHRPTPDMLAELNKRSAGLRAERAQLRRDLRSGTVWLADVICERPGCAREQLLYDLLLQQPFFGREKLRSLNLRAIGAGVNLAQTLGHAGERTRAWLVAEIEASR